MKNREFDWPKRYTLPIWSLRTVFQEIARKNNIETDCGGAIGFYRSEIKKGQKNSLTSRIDACKVHVFPLNVEKFTENFPNVGSPIMDHITDKKPYSSFRHLKNFQENHGNGRLSDFQNSHYYICLNDEEVIRYEKEGTSILIGEEEYSLIQIESDIQTQPNAKHLEFLPHLFFPSGTQKLIVIPIPALCSPVVLFFLPLSAFEIKGGFDKTLAKKFIIDLTNAAAEAVNFLLYHVVLEVIATRINYNIHINESQLFSWFVECVSNILLPITYSIDEDLPHPKFTWFTKKNSPTIKSVSFNFECELDMQVKYRHRLKLEMPDFYCPINSADEATRVSESEEFRLREQHIEVILNDIYRMTFLSWQPISNRNEQWAELVEPLVEKLKEVHSALPQIETSFNDIARQIEGSNEITLKLNHNIHGLRKGTSPNQYCVFQLIDKKKKPLYFVVFNEEEYASSDIGLSIIYKLLEHGTIKWIYPGEKTTSDSNSISATDKKNVEYCLTKIRDSMHDFYEHLKEMDIIGKDEKNITLKGEKKELRYDYSKARRAGIIWNLKTIHVT